MNFDLLLVAGKYFEDTVPREKEYLLKYFRGELQVRFLVYFIQFCPLLEKHSANRFYTNFYDHTGMLCARKVLRRYINRYHLLEKVVQDAKIAGDMNKLSEVRSGNFKLKSLGDRDRK